LQRDTLRHAFQGRANLVINPLHKPGKRGNPYNSRDTNGRYLPVLPSLTFKEAFSRKRSHMINARLSPSDYRRLQAVMQCTGVSVSDIVATLVTNYIDHIEKLAFADTIQNPQK